MRGRDSPFTLDRREHVTTFIETAQDMAWLVEVHGAPSGYAVAVLHGNEDAPDKVELYARNHYECVPTVMVPDADGTLHVVSTGELPS